MVIKDTTTLRAKVFLAGTLTFFSGVGSTALPLAPWILAALVYAPILQMPQAQILASDESTPWRSLGILIVSTTLSWLLSQASIVTTLVAKATRTFGTTPSAEAQIISPNGLASFASRAAWAVALPLVIPFQLAYALHSAVLYTLTAFLALVAISVASWLAIGRDAAQDVTWRILHHIHRHRLGASISCALLGLFPLLIGAEIATHRPMEFSLFGPLIVSMLGLSALSSFFGMILVALPACLNRPLAGIVALCATALFGALQHTQQIEVDNPLIRRQARLAQVATSADHSCVPIPSTLSRALVSHAGLRSPRPPMGDYKLAQRSPTYLISAEGGGIRAAYWTAMSLADLDVATDGRFAQQISVLSGVSGGSLGIATWLGALDRPNLTPQARVNLVAKFLRSDFLSPVVAGLFFVDIPRALLGPLWFDSSRTAIFELALVNQWKRIGKTDFFARPLLTLCMHGLRSPPAVFFNATDALTGSYFTLSPTSLDDAPGGHNESLADFRLASIENASVAQAVSISARFPYLMQPARIALKLGNTWLPFRLLVDGGYFDNTGVTPIKEALKLNRPAYSGDSGV